jgi:tyrosyl-tRNA synthetase
MPKVEFSRAKFEAGCNVVDLFSAAGLAPSKSEGRRLVQQGGAFVSKANGGLEAVTDVSAVISTDRLDPGGELVLRAGKKRYCLVVTA